MFYLARNWSCIIIQLVLLKFGNSATEHRQTLPGTIRELGYPVEEYKIVTEDQYILTTYRIPHGRRSNTTNTNAILMFHGMGGSCENFLVQGPDKAIGYYLADRGYDVWLLNARGTFHSKGHQIYDSEADRSYWNFSFHEIGVYDLPANIDFITNKTNQTKIFFLGHSQGATAFFVMMSERPEYNSKIKLNVELAPSVVFQYIKAPFAKIIANFSPIIENLLTKLNIYNLVPQQESMIEALHGICVDSKAFSEICTYVLYAVGGSDSGLINRTLIGTIFGSSLGGLSAKQAIHYLQVVRTGSFRQFDYGVRGNLNKYNRTKPPLYKLKQSTSPTALFHSEHDWFVPSEGVKDLIKHLPNVVLNYQVRYKNFNHVDFVFAYNVLEIINIPVYKILEKFAEKLS